MPSTPKRLTPEGMARWQRKETWTIYQTAFLLCGYEAPADMRAEGPTPDEVREAAENMGCARITGRPGSIGPEDENGLKYMLGQSDVLAWAASAYPGFLRLAVPAGQIHHADAQTTITLPASTRVVPTMAIPLLIAGAFHPGDDPNGTEVQPALRSHARMLNTAARDGAVQVVSYHGEPIRIGTEDAADCAGTFLAVNELARYLSGLAVPIALHIGGPEVQESVRKVRLALPAAASTMHRSDWESKRALQSRRSSFSTTGLISCPSSQSRTERRVVELR